MLHNGAKQFALCHCLNLTTHFLIKFDAMADSRSISPRIPTILTLNALPHVTISSTMAFNVATLDSFQHEHRHKIVDCIVTCGRTFNVAVYKIVKAILGMLVGPYHIGLFC